MLLVFLALPALQRGQRDTQRKNDVGRLQAAISQYKSRNNGRVPAANQAEWDNFFTNDMQRAGDSFADPVGGPYVANVRASGSAERNEYSEPDANGIFLYYGARCDGENPTGTLDPNARRIAIVKPLEGGGRHCQEA